MNRKIKKIKNKSKRNKKSINSRIKHKKTNNKKGKKSNKRVKSKSSLNKDRFIIRENTKYKRKIRKISRLK